MQNLSESIGKSDQAEFYVLLMSVHSKVISDAPTQ